MNNHLSSIIVSHQYYQSAIINHQSSVTWAIIYQSSLAVYTIITINLQPSSLVILNHLNHHLSTQSSVINIQSSLSIMVTVNQLLW